MRNVTQNVTLRNTERGASAPYKTFDHKIWIRGRPPPICSIAHGKSRTSFEHLFARARALFRALCQLVPCPVSRAMSRQLAACLPGQRASVPIPYSLARVCVCARIHLSAHSCYPPFWGCCPACTLSCLPVVFTYDKHTNHLRHLPHVR